MKNISGKRIINDSLGLDAFLPSVRTYLDNLGGATPDTTTQVTGVTGITTLDNLRGTTPTATDFYFLQEKGREGFWRIDVDDTTSIDNTATCIVTANGKRIKRLYEGNMNAHWFGMKPGIDNFPILRKHMDEMPRNTLSRIFWPAGTYYFSDIIEISAGMGIAWYGVESMPYGISDYTKFQFPQNKGGISQIGGRVHVAASGRPEDSVPVTPYDYRGEGGNPNYWTPRGLPSSMSDIILEGSFSARDSSGPSGVYHEMLFNFTRVWAKGFANAGFHTFAAVEYPMYGNSSLSKYDQCRATGNGNQGFIARGPDSNAISYMYCVAVENRSWGFEDYSLLGNYYYGCQTATNGRISEATPADMGGGFGLTGVNGSGAVTNCYSESDQRPNVYNASTCSQVDGLHDNGEMGQGSVKKGSRYSSLLFFGSNFTINGGGFGFHQTGYRSIRQYAKPQITGFYSEANTTNDLNGPFIEFLNPGAEGGVIGHDPRNSAVSIYRTAPFRTIRESSDMWLGNQFIGRFSGSDSLDMVYEVGDYFDVPANEWSPAKPERYRITKAGRTLNAPVPSGLLQSLPHGGFIEVTLANPQGYSYLRLGDRVSYLGAERRVTGIQPIDRMDIVSPQGFAQGQNIMILGTTIVKGINYTDSNYIMQFTPDYDTPRSRLVPGQAVVVDFYGAYDTTVADVREVNGLKLVDIIIPEGKRHPGMACFWFNGPGQLAWAHSITDTTLTLAFLTPRIAVNTPIPCYYENNPYGPVAVSSVVGVYGPNVRFDVYSGAPNGSSGEITILPPEKAAQGSGRGTLAQRPTNLTPADKGWTYVNLDTFKTEIWTGSTFV